MLVNNLAVNVITFNITRQIYTEVYRGIQRYTEVYRGIQRYTEVYRGIQNHSIYYNYVL